MSLTVTPATYTTTELSLDILGVLEGMGSLAEGDIFSDSESVSDDDLGLLDDDSSELDVDAVLAGIGSLSVDDDSDEKTAASGGTHKTSIASSTDSSVVSMTTSFRERIDSMAALSSISEAGTAPMMSPLRRSVSRQQVLESMKLRMSEMILKGGMSTRDLGAMDGMDEDEMYSEDEFYREDDDDEEEEKKRVSAIGFGKTVTERLRVELVELPELRGFLLKKSHSLMKGWQKRWFIVKRTHILWSKNEETIENPLDMEQRKKFQNAITLLQVSEVKIDGKDKKRRTFTMQTAGPKYLLRCQGPEERDQWVKGINAHLIAIKKSMQMMNDRGLFSLPATKRRF